MSEVDVRLVDVVKTFGDAVAVDHINLEVRDGEFFSLLGPSGCGKTTTLRMIGGFEQPTSGLIELQGKDVTWLPPYQRNVNTVFQSYALFPHLTIYENVAFGLRRKGVKDSEIKSRVVGDAPARRAARVREAQADPDLRRPGPARRPRPRPDQSAGRPPSRRAARRARPEAPQADAGRAEAHPAGGRDHVHLRDPRPGRGDDDVRSDRRHERRAATSSSATRRASTSARRPGSSPASSGSATCSRRRSSGTSDAYAIATLADDARVRVPKALVNGEQNDRGRRPPGEDPAAQGGCRDAPAGRNELDGTVIDASYLGVSHVRTSSRRARGRASRSTSRTWSGPSTARSIGPGDTVRLSWSPDHSFVGPGRPGRNARPVTTTGRA